MIKYRINKKQHQTIHLTQPGEYLVELVGEGAEADITGRYQAKGKDQLTVKLTIVHSAPHTRANTSLKGVAGGHSTIKFDGRIIVTPNCPDTNSFLEERILLISDTARAEVIPDLEIESDDVKCSHAATISRIPEEQLFYLMSRGISRPQAEKLIIEGFLGF